MIVAETDRLVLTQVTLDDADFFVVLMNTPSWHRFIGDRGIKTIDQAKEHLTNGILKSYKTDGFGFYIVSLKNNHQRVGICGMIKRPELEDVDIGFGFLPHYEGKGFGFESSQAVLKLAKEAFNLKKITAITDPLNVSSIKLLEKLGLSFEKRVRPFENEKELLLFAKDLN